MSNHAPPVHPSQHTAGQPSAYDVAGEQQKLWESILANQATHRRMVDQVGELTELIAMIKEPAQCIPVGFTQGNTTIEDREKVQFATRSIGLFNPPGAPGNVQFSGIGSASAADSLIVAAGKLLVVPISAQMVELSTSAVLGAGQSHYCFFFRFFSVQPAFYGG